MQSPEIEDQRRGYPEIHEIGKAIEFSTEARSAFEHPCDASIDSVQQCGKHNRRQRQIKLVLHRYPNCGQSRTQSEQGNKIWKQCTNGDRLKAAAKWRRSRVERRKDHDHNIVASRHTRHGTEPISCGLVNELPAPK